jgi:thymidine phosphorylase
MIMNKRTVCGMLLALGLLVSLGAQAAIVPWTATLDGAQEVPPNSGLATGSAFGTLDDISGLLSWNIVSQHRFGHDRRHTDVAVFGQ